MRRTKANGQAELATLCELLALSRRLAREMPKDASPAMSELERALACAELSAARLAAERTSLRRRVRA